MAHRITCLRPYTDEDTRARLEGALDRAGAAIVKTFDDPVDLAAVAAWLEGEGREDRLLIPFHGEDDVDCVRLVVDLQQAANVKRRVLVTVKTGSVVVARQRIEKALIAEARSRVMTQTFDQLVSPIMRPILARHLEYKQIGHLQ